MAGSGCLRDKLIIVGAILVLGAGIVLWRLTKSITDVDAEPPRAKAAPTEQVEPTETASTPSTPAKRDARIPQPTAVQPRSPSANAPAAGPALEPGGGSGSGSAAPVSHARMIERELKRQLVRQIDALEADVDKCLGMMKGTKLSGASAVTLKIERQKDQAVVTEVAVEPLETTIKDLALNNCLAATGRKIAIELPDDITEVTATHKVSLETGAVTAHDLTAYDFKPWGRPVDPPAPPK